MGIVPPPPPFNGLLPSFIVATLFAQALLPTYNVANGADAKYTIQK